MRTSPKVFYQRPRDVLRLPCRTRCGLACLKFFEAAQGRAFVCPAGPGTCFVCPVGRAAVVLWGRGRAPPAGRALSPALALSGLRSSAWPLGRRCASARRPPCLSPLRWCCRTLVWRPAVGRWRMVFRRPTLTRCWLRRDVPSSALLDLQGRASSALDGPPTSIRLLRLVA